MSLLLLPLQKGESVKKMREEVSFVFCVHHNMSGANFLFFFFIYYLFVSKLPHI